MTFQEQVSSVGLRLFEQTKIGLKDDLQYLTDKGLLALSEITLLMAEAAVLGQTGLDVSIVVNACGAALGNWESVAFVKAADRADAIKAAVMKAIGEALEIVLMVGLKAILPA